MEIIIQIVIVIIALIVVVAILAHSKNIFTSGGYSNLAAHSAMHDLATKDKQEAIEVVLKQQCGEESDETTSGQEKAAKNTP